MFWVPITLFISIAVVICALIYFFHRTRAHFQETVRLAIERGQALTPELLIQLGQPIMQRANADLRYGVLLIAFGAGLALFGLLVGEDDAVRPFIAIGNVPFLLGVAWVCLWKFAPRE